ncbi:MAG: M20/M25/M40 family metallo-hydrolase [Oscillospiraceae bacterium]|nr:M20/M25/M40 family metallo-hydrolase [Oscillospiraceae bacterium]
MAYRHIAQIETYLRDLSQLPGLAGHEQQVSHYMKAEFEKLGLPVTVDRFGNTYTTIPGTDPNAPSVLVTAHMDSLGFVVRRVDEDGFLAIERVGGIPEKTLSALRVSVQTKDGSLVDGIIGVKSHHITAAEDKYKVDKYQTLYVDIGCSSKAEVNALGIRVGSPVVYRPYYERMQGLRCNGTFFDNRVACAIALVLAQQLAVKPAAATVHIAGTVQEEYTIRGATLAARALKPDLCICLDLCMDGSTPDLKGYNEVEMGKGPAISLYNFHGRGTLNGVIPHPAMVRLFEDTAEETGLPLQRVAMLGGLSELAYMQLENDGICGIDVGVPGRYIHSQVETCDLGDMEGALEITEAAIRAVNAEMSLER